MTATSPLPAPGEPLEHYVSAAPFDPRSIEAMTKAQSKVFLASQWRLMWWKFKRHKMALISGVFLSVAYASLLLSEVIAPYNLHSLHVHLIHSPPHRLHLFYGGT